MTLATINMIEINPIALLTMQCTKAKDFGESLLVFYEDYNEPNLFSNPAFEGVIR